MKIIRSLAVLSAFFIASSALAQTSPVTNHAFAIGKGPGTGYTSLLCGSAQLAVGQSAADPICQTITGDVTISAAGVTAIGSLKVLTAMIANNAVTLAKLATIANNRALCNVSGGASVPVECTATQLTTLINTFTATSPGAVPAPVTATGKFLRDDSTWQPAGGTGTVTSAQISAGQGITVTTASGANPCTTTCNLTIAMNHTLLATALGADVAMTSASTYFDGPSGAQGSSGAWWASGTVSLTDPSAAAQFSCKLWDGTTVIASSSTGSAAGVRQSISLSGFLASPAGNIRISCANTSTTGVIRFNVTGSSKDSTVSVMRVQ